MATKTKSNPRDDFAAHSDRELHEELADLHEKHDKLLRQTEARRPTREAVAAEVDALHEKATGWFASRAAEGLRSATNAVPSALGFQPVERLVFNYVLASDDFAESLKRTLAETRPTEAELAPGYADCERMMRRCEAIEAELRLRALDRQRAEEEAERKALLSELES